MWSACIVEQRKHKTEQGNKYLEAKWAWKSLTERGEAENDTEDNGWVEEDAEDQKQ